MKLILANNQSSTFTDFYQQLQSQTSEPFDYTSYDSLLFLFNVVAGTPVVVKNLANKRGLTEYDGVYINGYLSTYELAATIAISCDALNIGYANRELHNPPSLSKLSMYAKLAAAKAALPPSICGAQKALLQAEAEIDNFQYPAVLKRADADRGIDNFKVASASEVRTLLADQPSRSLWVLQAFVPNDGYYLVSYYGSKPVFSIFRSLEERPDGNAQKAHMYKPKGGANAKLIEPTDVPPTLLHACYKALQIMDRQIGSVDCLYDPATDTPYILEVNYNPQLVTIETFKDIRTQAFLDYIPKIGTKL